ncbi:MAG: peptide chain release factor N(5)-glutamine methyltransferase [Acidaminococcaceae bacterium]|nr:peptide chain release factor N(5)-glutamine methyltransferase [Acidaminococcaceae bacterium]
MIWTIKSVLKWTQDYFTQHHIDSPRVDAEILLAKVLNCNRVKLYIDQDKPLSKPELAMMHNLVERRATHEPVAYILGEKGFMQDVFIVTPAVLVPRPETELLVERVAKLFDNKKELSILDIGTGSGAIVLSLLKLFPNARAKATDISTDALAVAQMNAEKLNLSDRVKFVKTDIYNGLDSQQFDVIVSNPPYIPTQDLKRLDEDVKKEPQIALDGGADGLVFYRRIINEAGLYLNADGLLALEIGIGQGEAVANLCRRAGFKIVRIVKDYAGIDRNILAAKEADDFGNKILAITL